MTRDKLIAEMDAKLAMPGVQNIWTQPIINRIEMLTTGIRTQIGVKIFGSDLNELERLSHEVAAALRNVNGAANVSPEPLTGAPYIDININRQAAARYGIDVKAIQDVIDIGIGETSLTVTIEAAHVLMAVPFALTGGVYLLYAMGYNFSVAVWVGFIALFGTAVQTGKEENL